MSKINCETRVLFLPGTIIHELAHLLTAGILFVPVGELTVLPKIEEKGVKLGSVQIGNVDPLRLTIIGVAPVIVGMTVILGIFYFAQLVHNLEWWKVIMGLYVIFEISNTMFSSKKDIEGIIRFVIAFLIMSLILAGVFYFLRPLFLQNIWIYMTHLNLEPFSRFFRLSSFYLLIPLLLDTFIILFTLKMSRFG